ncbi:MAG: aldo/keto reductase [Candidatus Hatepunaea meridiana]|nr:aldo/keto reductase [Candidatus Hatepunaea meridiana]
MDQDFLYTELPNINIPVHRLGLSATNRPGRKTIYKAVDEGLNLFFCYGFDTQMTSVMRDVVKTGRDRFVLLTGAYNLIVGHPNLRRTLEKRLRQLNTDYIDLFLFLGVMKEKQLTEHVIEELCRFREEGKIRCAGISCHDRKLVGKLADEGELDVFMMRYNAAHRGAEQDIFPHLSQHKPGVISYTATRWRYLLKRPKGWHEEGRIPTAGMCYRFVLSNPDVNVCLTAPSNIKQLEENLEGIRKGPLNEDEMEFMRKFGDAVHHTKKWFM